MGSGGLLDIRGGGEDVGFADQELDREKFVREADSAHRRAAEGGASFDDELFGPSLGGAGAGGRREREEALFSADPYFALLPRGRYEARKEAQCLRARRFSRRESEAYDELRMGLFLRSKDFERGDQRIKN